MNAVRRAVPTDAREIAILDGGPTAVAGNTAVITPELAEFVLDVAPATVKKFAVTPVSV